jgi:hypothetical protein
MYTHATVPAQLMQILRVRSMSVCHVCILSHFIMMVTCCALCVLFIITAEDYVTSFDGGVS